MKYFLHLFIFALFGKLISSFDCSNITNQTKCNYLNADGCNWNGSGCSGRYSPACLDCYYVDSYSTNGTSVGTIESPYKSLSDGLLAKNDPAKELTFIILNYRTSTNVTYDKSVVLTSNVTIIPLFEDEMYNLDFENFPGKNGLSMIKTGKYFRIKGAHIQYQLFNLMSVVETPTPAANVTFENINFVNCSAPMLGNILKVMGTVNFTYLEGTISNSYARFLFQTGTSYTANGYWKDVKYRDSNGGTSIFFLKDKHVFENFHVSNIFNVLIFSPWTSSSGSFFSLTLIGALFEYSMFVFWNSIRIRHLTVKDSFFRHLTNPTPLFELRDVDVTSTNLFEDTTFYNISVPQSIFSVSKNGIQLILNRVVMNDIKIFERKEPEDLQAQNKFPGGLCVLADSDASIVVNSSNFTNIHSHCFGIRNSALVVEDSIFDNSDLPKTPISINSTSINTLTKNSGVTWINIEDLTQINNLGYQVILKRNFFKENKLVSLYGGAIRYGGSNAGQIYAKDNQFIGLSAAYGGAIYGKNPLLGFNFSNNIFKDNEAYDGGALYKASQGGSRIFLPSIQIDGDQFIGNKAVKNGGAAYFEWESLKITDGVFDGNNAHNGGAIYFTHLDVFQNGLYGRLSGTRFVNNCAVNVGGAMKLFFDYSDLMDDSSFPTYFFNNTDYQNLTGVSSGKPAYYMFSFYKVLVEKTFTELDDLSQYVTNSTRTALDFRINTSDPNSIRSIPHKSGHEVDHIIAIHAYDDRNEFIDYIDNEEIIAQVTETKNSTSGFQAYTATSPIYFVFQRGVIYFKTKMKLFGEPYSQATLKFLGIEASSSILKTSGILMDFNLDFVFKECEVGDIYDNKTKTCDTCAKGTYSLRDPYAGDTTCLPCDSHEQLCLGGSKIAPQAGYWRYDINTPVVIPCPENSACQGGLVEEKYYPQGLCNFPYEGNLCNKCVSKHAKFGSSETCNNCENDGLYYVKFLGFFVLRVGAVVYSIQINLTKISGKKKEKGKKDENGKSKNMDTGDFQSNLMKIVVNFLQISTIIFQYKFEWPDLIVKVINVTNKFVPINTDGFSIDCLVALSSPNNENVYFIKLIVTLLEPLALWMGLFLVYIAYLKYCKEKIKGNPKVKKNMIVLFVVTAFLVQPTLIQATLELFKCINISSPDDPVYFMSKNPQVECWTSKHILWSLGVAFPFFLLWGIVLPAVLLRKIMAKSLHKTETYTKYAFVYEGLKIKRYYWEFVTLLRKTLIIIIFVFFNIITVQAQAFATFMVILCFTILHIKYWPYEDKRLNRLELFSLCTLGVMSYCGMFFLSGGSTEPLTIFLIVVSLIFNIVFYAAVGIYFLKTYKKKAQKISRKITAKVKTATENPRSRSNKSSDSSPHSETGQNKSPDQVKNIEDILDNTNLDSPKKIDDNNDKKTSESDLSAIPSETFDDPSMDKRNIFNNSNDISHQSPIVRNFGLKEKSPQHQRSINSSIYKNSPHSSLSLFPPDMSSSQFSNRKLLNNSVLNDNTLLKPKPFAELEDSKLMELSCSRNFGANYEDFLRFGSSRNNQQASSRDDSIILKIPLSPSEIINKIEGEK